MRNDKEKYPQWMLKFVDGDDSKAEKLKNYHYDKEPFAEGQEDYTVKDAAKMLEISPVTLRQYIREGKIFARKYDEWHIPIDAILRFIYARENEHQPDENVPMGFIQVKEKDDKGDFTKYEIISDKELRDILCLDLSEDDLYNYFNIDRSRYILEDLLAANAFSFSEDKDAYMFSPKIKKQLAEIAKKDNWRDMPISLMKAKYKKIFNKTPDIEDVRLFRSTIEDIEWNENKFFLEDALLAELTEHIIPTNRVIYAYNRRDNSIVPKKLLKRAEDILDIFWFKGFYNIVDHTWKGPNSRMEHDLSVYYNASTFKELEDADIDDIHEVLEEMVNLANSPKFKEYEKEYEAQF